MKNTRFANFCADRIDVITNFAVITNAVIKMAHCIICRGPITALQVDRYTLRGSHFHFHFVSILNRDQHFKVRICSSWSDS